MYFIVYDSCTIDTISSANNIIDEMYAVMEVPIAMSEAILCFHHTRLPDPEHMGKQWYAPLSCTEYG